MKKFLLTFFVAGAAVAGFAEVMDRPGGFRIGQRMTLRPYVSLYYTYDSNTYGYKDSGSASSWSIMPGTTLNYRGENWNLEGGGNLHQQCRVNALTLEDAVYIGAVTA